MPINVRALRRESEIRTWANIIGNNPLVAVVQATGGRAWGRTNLKHRILEPHRNSPHVNTRFAVPRHARDGALRTNYVGLSDLFRAGPSAVVYGDDVECVVDVVKRAMDLIDGSVLLGGRFGDGIITARVWEEVLESEGETAEWCKFLAILGRRPEVVDVLSAGSRGLVDALGSGGPRRLVNVVGKIEGASNSS